MEDLTASNYIKGNRLQGLLIIYTNNKSIKHYLKHITQVSKILKPFNRNVNSKYQRREQKRTLNSQARQGGQI